MEFLLFLFLGKPVWMWLLFLGIVALLLVLDLGVLHKGGAGEIGVAESLRLSAMYIALGLSFSGFIWWQMGWEPTADYLTAFVVEKTLALDNIFVIALIFGMFAIPRHLQHRVLFWGILGVIVLRGLMIGFGATLVAQYEWVLYIFAAFLIFTGFKMMFVAEKPHDVSENRFTRFIRNRFNVTDGLREEAFFVREADPKTGVMTRFVTPLFLALVMIELADLVFAVDSVPAVFTITTDPFIVYTSNIFAILGLRALYFALAAMIHRFAYLKYALALVLVFIGAKIFLVGIIGKIPPSVSLTVTFGLIAGGVIVSLWKTRGDQAASGPA